MNDMIRINLLDWREAMREERRRNFLGALSLTALVCAGIIAFVTLFIYGNRIDAQRQRKQWREQEHKPVIYRGDDVAFGVHRARGYSPLGSAGAVFLTFGRSNSSSQVPSHSAV